MGAMSGRVLVVDDDRAIRESLARALELDGYDVELAADGAAALAAIRERRPDVAVLDVMMPNIDGLTVCRVLRAERDRLPVLMLTARTETQDRVAGLDAGADDYLPKPFELDELLARLRALLRRARPDEDDPTGTGALQVADLRVDPSSRRAVEDRVRSAGTARAQQRHRPRPHHHLRADLELRLRARLEEPRRVHQLPPAQDRRRRPAEVDPHRARGGLHGARPVTALANDLPNGARR